MHSSLIATILAAAVAGSFTLLTELIAVNNGSGLAHPQSDMSKPAAKGDRLDRRPAKGCSFARNRANYETDCVRLAEAE